MHGKPVRGGPVQPARASEPLEVPRDGPALVARRFVSASRWRVTLVVHGLDHRHRHAGSADLLLGEGHEAASDAFALVFGRHRDDVDLTHPILRVEPNADEPGELVRLEGQPDVLRLGVEQRRHVGRLPDLPTARVEGLVDEPRDLVSGHGKDGRPSPHGKVDHLLPKGRPIALDTTVDHANGVA